MLPEKDRVNFKGFTVSNLITDFYYDFYLGYADYMFHNMFQKIVKIKYICFAYSSFFSSDFIKLFCAKQIYYYYFFE
jgi:hypothetical protein